MEKVIRVVAVFFLWSGMVWADAGDSLRKANNAYADGKFSDAAALYENARKEGLRHWALEYNLGNAYYRTGQNGKAVASYWRAFRLHSGDRDVIDNLNLAASKAGDPVLPSDGLASFFWRAFFSLSLNTLAFFASLMLIVLCGIGMVWVFRDWSPPIEALALAAMMSLTVWGWLGGRWLVHSRPIAIVTSTVAEVRSGPHLSYPANFTVPEGRRVLVLKVQEPIPGWIEIGVPAEGLKGWVPESAVDVL